MDEFYSLFTTKKMQQQENPDKRQQQAYEQDQIKKQEQGQQQEQSQRRASRDPFLLHYLRPNFGSIDSDFLVRLQKETYDNAGKNITKNTR